MQSIPTVEKVILIEFWTCEGIIFMSFLPKATIVNAENYSNLLFGPLWLIPIKKTPWEVG